MNILKQLHDLFVPHARNNYTPHALAHRSLSFYAGMLVSVKLLTLLSLDMLPQNQAFSSAVEPNNILQLTNLSRQAFGLNALKANAMLNRAAQDKAEDMLKNQYFSHNSPQGLSPWDFIKSQGYNYIIAGENLAINFYTSEAVEQAWMNSPGHKANILNKDFDDIGIGVVQGTYKGIKAIFVVEMFGSSIDQPFNAKISYDAPQIIQPKTTLAMPVPTAVALAAPIIDGSDFTLTNNRIFILKGYAPGANAVYVLVNHVPEAKFNVIENHFSGSINLPEGTSTINVISFDYNLAASPISKTVDVKVDSAAPLIAGTQIKTIPNVGTDSSNQAYMIEVQTQGDATKVIANLGDENILLQPTSDPNVWQGIFEGKISELQGNINVTAYDLAGNSKISNAGSLSRSVIDVFGFNAKEDYRVAVLNGDFSLKSINQIYIYAVLLLLVGLALAIGIRRKVQNIGLIAHTSAMIAVALIFWVT